MHGPMKKLEGECEVEGKTGEKIQKEKQHPRNITNRKNAKYVGEMRV